MHAPRPLGLPNWWPLERVILREPTESLSLEQLLVWGYSRPFGRDEVLRDHRAFQQTLRDAGVQVTLNVRPGPGLVDSVFATDVALPTQAGFVLLRFGKVARRPETQVLEAHLNAIGASIIGRIDAPGTVEGGDCLWLDETTLLVGEGYRTNAEGIAQLGRLLPGIDVVTMSLPHAGGPSECLHLQSLLSVVRADLVLAYPSFMPVRLVSLLEARAIGRIDVPTEEYVTLGTNALCVRDGHVILADDNPRTAAALRGAGVRVDEVPGDLLLRNGSGGPTCLTLVASRGRTAH
jgi:dimethylargininase